MKNQKFRNKYRIESARRPKWDYGQNAFYYVTLCTLNREHFFGEIVNGEMQYTQIGEQANACWSDIPNHFPFVELDAHIVMPNHVHGILSINKNNEETQDVASQNANVKTQDVASRNGNVKTQDVASHNANEETQDVASHNGNEETQNLASLRISENKFGPQSKNLGSIVRGFKIGVTKYARYNHIGFAWQPRFHDRIVRNNVELERIRKYILDNPMKWFDDRFY